MAEITSFVFLGLSVSAWITLLVIIGLVLALSFTKTRTDVVFLCAIILLLVTGVVPEEKAFVGLSSHEVVICASLFIVVGGLTYTGFLNVLVKRLGKPDSLNKAIPRVMFPVAILSSLIGQTTVVAMFINVVRLWTKKLNITPSKLLIPVSYAACMGGACTLIGTQANLIIANFYATQTGEHLSFFAPTICGVICLIFGVFTMMAMSKYLPSRKSPMEGIDTEDFTAELTVPSDSLLIGSCLNEVGYFDDKETLRVVAIRRFDNEIVDQVANDEFIMGGDRLIVTGKTEALLQLCRKEHLENENIEGILMSEGELGNSRIGTIKSSLILMIMILLSAFNVIPMMHSCLLAAVAMVVCKCCNVNQAMKSIEWDVILIFAGSICIGTALESTELDELMAKMMMAMTSDNPYITLLLLCIIATFVTEFLEGTVTAALFCPLALNIADTMNANPMTFVIALMIAVSSSFATPLASAAHTHVYVPGGYKFSDFSKMGIPMNIILLFVNLLVCCLIFPING